MEQSYYLQIKRELNNNFHAFKIKKNKNANNFQPLQNGLNKMPSFRFHKFLLYGCKEAL